MHGYTRPPLPHPVFHDADGEVIPYGQRWKDQDWDGPEETYSVTAHPERFAPFVDVAQAILEHLVATYDVRREDSVRGDTGCVRLIPNDPTAAPLTFAFDPFPMVQVTAGATTSLGWFCGCDHCDEDVEVAIENLEDEIALVTDGGLREWLNEGGQAGDDDDLFLAYSLGHPDGGSWGSGSSDVSSESRRQELRRQFADVPPRWAPWTLRRR